MKLQRECREDLSGYCRMAVLRILRGKMALGRSGPEGSLSGDSDSVSFVWWKVRQSGLLGCCGVSDPCLRPGCGRAYSRSWGRCADRDNLFRDSNRSTLTRNEVLISG